MVAEPGAIYPPEVRSLSLAAVLAAALPALATRAAPAPATPHPQDAKGADEDFEPEIRAPSLVFGSGASGRNFLAWADVGWLRSGVGVALSLSDQLDLGLRGTAFLLHGGFAEQNEVDAFLRWAPAADVLRAALALETGIVTFGGSGPPGSSFSFRLDAAVGAAFEGIATPYLRGAFRVLDFHAPDHNGWAHDEELGAGVERTQGRFVVGVEAFVWARPELRGLAEWRVRVGWAP